MIEQDTIRLLRECDAGVKMGVESIEEVVDKIQSEDFRQVLVKSRRQHDELDREIQQLLSRYRMRARTQTPWQKACPG